MQQVLRGAQGMAMLVAALTVLGGATGMLLRGERCPVRGVRGGDLAYASYDFTTKATGTLRTKAQEEPPLFPKVQDIPVIADLHRMYMDYEQQKKHKAMRAVGKVDTSAFPKEGCVVRGRSALCSVPLDVNVEGFVYKADITLGLRMNPVNNTLTESLYVDGYERWKGSRPAQTPGMCFFLKRSAEAPDVTQVFAIAPGPEDQRKLPMELAIRFDKVKSKTDFFGASLRAECKAMGKPVASVPIGRVKIE